MAERDIQELVNRPCAKMTGEQENKTFCLPKSTGNIQILETEIRQEQAIPVPLLLWIELELLNPVEYRGD